MPIGFDPPHPIQNRAARRNCLHIGLINNMPTPALEATERQFYTLLDSASEEMVVRVSLYALPEVSRTPEGIARVANCYSSIASLLNTRLDGLIVTGTEPLAPALWDEPYWGSLTAVLEWAEHNTSSTIWSCLAAQAAVLKLDGIPRRRMDAKLCGVFECAKRSDTSLTLMMTNGYPDRLQMPHSRWHDIPADSLKACGYRFLTQSEDAGIDSFVKPLKSLFVFFQGHPEYEAESLLLEYRRDIRRFLKRERESYPAMPRGCFDEDDAGRLTALRERVLCDRREELLADFPFARLVANARNTWQQAAVSVYRNWLRYLCARKTTHRIRPVGRLRQEHSPFEGRRAVCQ